MICAESGSWLAASSSRTTLTAAIWSRPPSDHTFEFWPPGPTSRMSMSSGHGCEAPLITRLRSVIVPEKPEAVQVDGYGIPFPESGIMTAPPLQVPGGGGGGGGGSGGGGGGGTGDPPDLQAPSDECPHMAGGIVDQVEPQIPYGAVPSKTEEAHCRRSGSVRGRKRIASAVVERLVGGAVDQLGFVQ